MSSACQTYVAVVDDDESGCRALSRLLRAEGIRAIPRAASRKEEGNR